MAVNGSVFFFIASASGVLNTLDLFSKTDFEVKLMVRFEWLGLEFVGRDGKSEDVGVCRETDWGNVDLSCSSEDVLRLVFVHPDEGLLLLATTEEMLTKKLNLVDCIQKRFSRIYT